MNRLGPRSKLAPVDAISSLRHLAPTRAKAQQNLGALNRFLEECLQNIADQLDQVEQGQESITDKPTWGVGPHGHRHATRAEDAADSSGAETTSSASAAVEQWVLCVRHMFNLCMPHVGVTQVIRAFSSFLLGTLSFLSPIILFVFLHYTPPPLRSY